MVHLHYGIKGLLHVHWFSIRKWLSCTGQNLSLRTSHLCYFFPGILALGASDLVIGTPFAKAGCLQQHLALQPPIQCAGLDSCRVFWFFNLASMSVDGCYLYIIIHHGMSQRDCRIRLVPRGGRPDPESFKVVDTYTYRKNHTNSPYVCPRVC